MVKCRKCSATVVRDSSNLTEILAATWPMSFRSGVQAGFVIVVGIVLGALAGA